MPARADCSSLIDQPQPRRAGQHRLPAVQDGLDGGDPVRVRVLGDPARGLAGYGVRDGRRAALPALVRSLVDIAVVASQITTAVHLQDEPSQQVLSVPLTSRAPAQMLELNAATGTCWASGEGRMRPRVSRSVVALVNGISAREMLYDTGSRRRAGWQGGSHHRLRRGRREQLHRDRRSSQAYEDAFIGVSIAKTLPWPSTAELQAVVIQRRAARPGRRASGETGSWFLALQQVIDT